MAYFRLIFLAIVLSFFIVGIHDFLSNFESNQCEMTYMFENPEYLKIKLSDLLQTRFPKYNLYFYGEGKYAKDMRSSKFHLTGIPVLFIPGNAGSYRQVRSLGSVAQRMGDNLKANYHFNFFALDLNEEMSALFGPLLTAHTKFANECIKHILSMYGVQKGKPAIGGKPDSVVLVGHSMGGVICRALFTLPGFNKKSVHTIITQATPHQHPVIAIDSYLVDFYDKVNKFWIDNIEDKSKLEDVTVFSTGGGYRDVLVRSGLTSLDGIVNRDRSISAVTMSVPRAWASTDHLCHVWCKQIVLATVRALFDIVDKTTKQIAVNPSFRVKPFNHHFEKNPGIKQYKASHDMMIPLAPSTPFEIRKKMSWKFVRPSVISARYSAIKLPKELAPLHGFVAISNVDNVAWFGGCSIRPTESKCTQVGNFARYANMLPKRESGLKVAHLDSYRLDMFEHWAVIIPESKTPVLMMYDMYQLTERNLVHNVTTFVDFFRHFPSRIMSNQVVINSTKSQQLFFNISLSGLVLPLQAYTANIITRSCRINSSEGADTVVAKFHIPWSSGESTYTVVPRGMDGQVSLKLQSGRPDGYVGGNPELHLYLMPTCSYQVTIGIAWTELPGQFFRFYAVFLPAYLVMQVLMALSWQLMSLEEQGSAPGFIASHTRWAQPYRVCLVATIFRFLISYPEEDNFAVFVGLPSDDTKALQNANIWYPALPVVLYLFSYSSIGLYGHIAHMFIVGLARITASLFDRCFKSAHATLFFTRGQYVLLLLGAIAAGTMCGTIGILVTYLIYVVKMLSNYVKSKKNIPSHPGDHSASWTDKFNVNFSIMLLLLMSVYLNAPSLIVWSHSLSWDSLRLTVDPSRTSGVLLCLAAAMTIYSDFPFTRHDLTNVMGVMAYICCILMVLYSTVSVYRVSYFINATLMTIAVPSLLFRLTGLGSGTKKEIAKNKDE